MSGAEKTYAYHMVRTDSREQKLDAFVKPVPSSSSADRTTQPIRSDSAQPMETSTSDQTYVIITFLIGIYSSCLNKRPMGHITHFQQCHLMESILIKFHYMHIRYNTISCPNPVSIPLKKFSYFNFFPVSS